MKVLIIEDEHLAAEKLEKMLLKIDSEIRVVARLESVIDSINWLSNNKPDLIFLDIQLDDGISFEIFDSIKLDVPIIFTTAYDQYAIKAFQVNSVDYLLKPIEEQALIKSLEKFRSIYQSSPPEFEKIQVLYDQLVKNYKTRFFVKIGNHFHSVTVNEIQCFLIRERATFLRTIGGKKYDLDHTLWHHTRNTGAKTGGPKFVFPYQPKLSHPPGLHPGYFQLFFQSPWGKVKNAGSSRYDREPGKSGRF
jgi:DNA-binding LytR/AlgR family response regulator